MKSLLKKIEYFSKSNPYKNAYIVGKNSISYLELWTQASKLALSLSAQGTEPVIIYGHKETEVLVCILACIISNRNYIPIDISLPLSRLIKIREASNASLIINVSNLEISNLENYALEDLISENDLSTIKENSNELVYTIFTSGTTGSPKGVPISKKNLNNFINWINSLKPLNQYKNIVVFNQANFSFDLSVADLYYSLSNGHTLVSLDSHETDLVEILKVFKDERINVAFLTPTFIKLCLLSEYFNEKNLKNLKCIYFCGECLEVKTVCKLYEAFPNLEIINAYGPTEATSAISAINITKDMLMEKLLPVGDIHTLATEVEIKDNEIVLKGASVFGGYLGGYIGGFFRENNENCYRTGDLGYICDEKLYCKGRADNQIKYKGYRIELADIENNILSISGVDECVVVPLYNDMGIVKSLKAFVVSSENLMMSEIKQELKKYLPYYMIPNIFEKIDSLPMTINGKVDRKKLLEIG